MVFSGFLAIQVPDFQAGGPGHWVHSKGCLPYRAGLPCGIQHIFCQSYEHHDFQLLHSIWDQQATGNDNGHNYYAQLWLHLPL